MNEVITEKYQIMTFSSHVDSRGNLYHAEYPIDLPFVVKRIYYISNVTDSHIVRGYHAHKKLQQVIFCVGGSCDLILDDGFSRTTITLDCPNKALFLKPGMWREITNFSENATLIVLASDVYDETDYIRDYDSFKSYISGGVL